MSEELEKWADDMVWILEATRPWGISEQKFEAGEWMVEAATAAQALMQNAPGTLWVERMDGMDNVGLAGCEEAPDSVLVVRSGGFGDVLFTTPLLREMRGRWPSTRIGVAVLPHFSAAVSGCAAVDEVVGYPVALREWRKWERVVWLDGVMEWHPRARDLHAVDLLALAAGLELEDGDAARQVDAPIPGAVRPELQKAPGKRWVGVQLRASAAARTYPWNLMHELLGRLMAMDEKVEVVVFGTPARADKALQALAPKMRWMPALDAPPSFAESCGILQECDVVVAPDSALCHVAGAMGIPTVALYGPFPWRIRTAHAPSIRSLTGHAPCAPCFWHERTGTWPKGMPCESAGHCVAMAEIAPERIVSEVRKRLR